MSSILSLNIQHEKNRLVKLVNSISPSDRNLKNIEGTGGKVSTVDLISYQIGWGKALIRWYEAGIQGIIPEMPGDGFSNWEYVAIAQSFYLKYNYNEFEKQMGIFHEVVSNILQIVEAENKSGNLDQVGIWPWCTLPSGKQWSLSKWIRVNTVSPYKRAYQLIKKANLCKPFRTTFTQ